MADVTRSSAHVLGSAFAVVDAGEDRDGVPTVYVQAGLHANETTGVGVLHVLVDRYERQPCPVRLRLVPHANPLGWVTYLESGNGRFSRPNYLNWNRIFDAPPPTGGRLTAEQSLAGTLLRLSDGYQHVLDLHTPEFGWPHLYTSSMEHRLRTFDDLPHVIDNSGASTFSGHHALRDGTQVSVTVELPSHRPQSTHDLAHWAARLHDELCAIRDEHQPDTTPVCGVTMIDLNAAIDGVCFPVAQPARRCREGEVVATIIAPSGRREELVAPVDMLPLCYRRSAAVQRGGWAVRGIALAPGAPA
jgi:predicted deacylase